MLRIGFDAKRAFLNTTGLGNYSRSVISSLAHCYPDDRYYLYTPKTGKHQAYQAALQHPALFVRTPRFPVLRSAWRSRFVVPQLVRDQLDVYHGLSHEIPLGIGKTNISVAVTIHDLIFLRYPHYYKAADRKIYELKFRAACRHADIVIAISEQTKRDIMAHFDTSEERIRVIYQSCDPLFRLPCTAEKKQEVRAKYGLPEQYLLTIGTIEERKNLLLIAKTLRRLPEDIILVAIGKPTAYAQLVKDYLQREGLAHRVLFPASVPFGDLPALYQAATLFLYPSRFEGFGIPVLEALCSGTPVIAATGSCLEEAGGPDSIYISPDDEEALTAAIDRLWYDPAQRESMRIKGKVYSEAFTEPQHARRLMQVYHELAGHQ